MERPRILTILTILTIMRLPRRPVRFFARAPARLPALFLCLAMVAGPSPAQPATEQDGIRVRPLSAWTKLQSAEQFDRQAEQQYRGLLDQAQQQGALVRTSHPQVIRLREIARRLIPYAARWNPAAAHWQWEVNILHAPQVNAFCMPGGRIVFYSGILDTLKLSDDEVAAVMGHEIAHALREHSREQAGKTAATSAAARLAGAGLSAWLGVDPRLTGTATGMAAKGLALKYSRDDEREADLVGLDLAARAGFDPRAGVALWRKMGSLSKETPPPWLSTHPSGGDRIALIEQNMHLLLPLYARSQNVSVNALPPYRAAPPAGK